MIITNSARYLSFDIQRALVELLNILYAKSESVMAELLY